MWTPQKMAIFIMILKKNRKKVTIEEKKVKQKHSLGGGWWGLHAPVREKRKRKKIWKIL